MVAPAVMLLAGLAGGATFGAVSNPLMNVANQEMNKLIPATKPNINELVNLRHRAIIDEATYNDLCATWGYTVEFASALYAGQNELVGIQETIDLFRRNNGKLTDADNRTLFFRRMQELGVTEPIAASILESKEVIANEQQLITFMVREVFDSATVEKFGQDKEFPDDKEDNKTPILPEFAKLGISETLARRLWSAHWELPSVQTVAQAMFRYAPDVIDEAKEDLEFLDIKPEDAITDKDTVDLLLKTQDVMPFWRDRTRATLFNNLSRVDVRRMIRLRIFNFQQGNYEYRKQGYTPKDARRLTKFGFVAESLTTWKTGIKSGSLTIETILEEAREWNIETPAENPAEQTENENIIAAIKRALAPELAEGVEDFRKLSVSKIMRALTLEIIPQGEAVEMLQQINYSEEQAKFMVEITLADIEAKKTPSKKEKFKTKGDIKKGFREGKFTLQQAIDELVEIGTNRQAAEEIMDIERIALARKEKA